VAAIEYLGAGRGGPNGPVEDVGKPREVVLQALEHLAAPSPGDAPASDDPPAAAAATSGRPAAGDDGLSIWRDLPEGGSAGAADVEPAHRAPAEAGPIEEEEEGG
jgi:hypothetical protein